MVCTEGRGGKNYPEWVRSRFEEVHVPQGTKCFTVPGREQFSVTHRLVNPYNDFTFKTKAKRPRPTLIQRLSQGPLRLQ